MRWAVRRPPLDHVLPTALDMAREHLVLAALHATSAPAPQPLLLCQDPDVLGAPVYMMEHVEGTPYRERSLLDPLGLEPSRSACWTRW
ncbi:phosphotransferase [Streptomyces sp. NBC_00063]|uniref:phosphotransferase n=1 Tax=Streptomyces sp. NBC_00063 TaxID=2975638 RepID=UPI003D70B455